MDLVEIFHECAMFVEGLNDEDTKPRFSNLLNLLYMPPCILELRFVGEHCRQHLLADKLW
jgi:hypothetical protein